MGTIHIPGPWKVTFHGNMASDRGNKHVGFFVSRMRPDFAAPNAKEWMLDARGQLRRYGLREDAFSAIDKANGQ